MNKKYFALSLCLITAPIILSAHCQMPCGIYHDDMVFDQIDQYVETMYKGMSMLRNSKFDDADSRNTFVRWVALKEKLSDDTAQLLMEYFLQQKIKPGEPDTAKRLESVHKMLFLIVKVKQNTDRKVIEEFNDVWEKFKLMFHVEGYECKMNLIQQKKREELQKAEGDHDHDHDHEHGDEDHDHDHDHDHDDHHHDD